MKKTMIKRLTYYVPQTGETMYGAEEYDARLTDDNILCFIHEVGKTTWMGDTLWLLRDGVPTYRINVESFYQYTKSWFDLLLDAVRRI